MVPRTTHVDTIASNCLAHFKESCEFNIGYRRLTCKSSLNTIGKIHFTSAYSVFLSGRDRKSTRLNSSHITISYAVFCLKKKKKKKKIIHLTKNKKKK